MRLRFLLDTNILIPLQDSNTPLNKSLINFTRLANIGGHQLLYHPASLEDIKRDSNEERRQRTLARIEHYQQLENPPQSPYNRGDESPNDRCDNEILYALKCHATHALITEDKGLHSKAKNLGLQEYVYTIQTAEDWLLRLDKTAPVQLPNILDTEIYHYSSQLNTSFFDSLREDYPNDFNSWFVEKAKAGRRAWVCHDDENKLAAICIYTIQENIEINDAKKILSGKSLKLCTFKVGDSVRGRKIGELFLKASFLFASGKNCNHIFIHGNQEKQSYLAALLEDFGFNADGTYGPDTVWVKEHPQLAPNIKIDPKTYVSKYFPHFRDDPEISKYIVPIKPEYHEILFPDHNINSKQLPLFDTHQSYVGNAIKLAYLCHAQIKSIKPGDIILFYRSTDAKILTTLGVVDDFRVLKDPNEIAVLVSRRTVYSSEQIQELSKKTVKVILFRLIKHFENPIPSQELTQLGILAGAPQSIVKIDDQKYRNLKNATTS